MAGTLSLITKTLLLDRDQVIHIDRIELGSLEEMNVQSLHLYLIELQWMQAV